MDILEYIQGFHKQVDRNRTLFHEAWKLGHYEKAEEFKDELYALIFNHYQLINTFRRTIQEKASQEEDPVSIKIVQDLERSLGSYDNELAEILNKFVSDKLGIGTHSN